MTLHEAVNNARKRAILSALQEHNGHIGKAATDLRVDRVTIHRWLREYDLTFNRVVTAKIGEVA